MNSIPAISTAQMRQVDRLMIEVYHIALIQMMENAGRNLAHLARQRFLAGDPRGRTVIVLAGRGGNGGGGLVCARHLHNWGATVWNVLSHPEEAYQGVAAHQLEILQRMGVPVIPFLNARLLEASLGGQAVDLIVDAVIGYSLSGTPHGAAAGMIHWANAQNVPILSLDVPSGIDATTGKVHTPTIRATATMTLALPKQGLRSAEATDYVGELYLADIGVPPELYASIGLTTSVSALFARDEIIRV